MPSVVSLKDQAAAALRREIYAGELPDGAELRQEDIAAQLGISRLPVREAMQQLQNEGLLERLPNRHVRVVGVTAARLRQSFAVLAAMECELFALADTALREKGLPDPACDAEFHLAAAEVLENPTLYQRFFTQRQGLLDAAQALGADYLATGHYAKIRQDPATGRHLLCRGADRSKDQSYFLCRLTQEQLSRTLFPLGDLEKSAVRALAEAHGLINAQKRDSQDICFVPDGD